MIDSWTSPGLIGHLWSDVRYSEIPRGAGASASATAFLKVQKPREMDFSKYIWRLVLLR